MTPTSELLDALEARIDALGPKAYSCTLSPADLSLFGIPSTHKKRRYIAWTRRKIEAARLRIANQVAAKLAGPFWPNFMDPKR